MTTSTIMAPTGVPFPPRNTIERKGLTYILVPEGLEQTLRQSLENLGIQLLNRMPGLKFRVFANFGGSIYLHCYLEMSLPHKEDALVASVAYENNLGRFLVSAYVCGEESGNHVWDRTDVEVNPNDLAAVERTLLAAADDLTAHSVDAIIETLK